MDWMAILIAAGVLLALGVIFGVILSLADKKFFVPTDERVQQVRCCLGGANCGACGFAGCDAFAESVVEGNAKIDGCPPGGSEAAQAIGKIMGIEAPIGEKKVAKAMCRGTCDHAKSRYEYDEYTSCSLAVTLAGGPKECRFSCVGLGDCVKVCSFGGIRIEDGVAKVDTSLCTACGMCVNVCPRDILQLVPDIPDCAVVLCRNGDVGKAARAVCDQACFACGKCTRVCEHNAIILQNGIATIDYEACVRCGKCVEACPAHCIQLMG